MRAMILNTPSPISGAPLTESIVDDPVPGPREVLIRVSACGVCHTDLHTVEGDLALPKLPVVPGHQVVGEIESCGGDVAGFSPGQRVGAAWLGQTCGTCRFCLSERENLCEKAVFTGYHRDGGYAQKITVDGRFVYPLEAGLPDLQAAPLLCAGIIGYRALKLSGIGPGGRLGLYGFGASAHVTIQLATNMGCRVFVFSRGQGRRSLAEKLGAVWTGQVPGNPPEPLDASIVFAPAGDLVPPALEVLDRGGRLVLAGIHMSEVPPLEYDKHLYYEKSILSVTANTRADGEAFLNLAASIPVRTTVTPYPLAEANKALRDLKEGRVDGAAVLVP